MSVTINIAEQFSRFPFGRYADHGPHNGARFRDDFLVPQLKTNDRVTVDLTGARGLAPSFLEEAFGGLVRAGFSLEQIETALVIVSKTDPSLVDEVLSYIREAAGRAEPAH